MALPAISPGGSPSGARRTTEALQRASSAPVLPKDGPLRREGAAAARVTRADRQLQRSSVEEADGRPVQAARARAVEGSRGQVAGHASAGAGVPLPEQLRLALRSAHGCTPAAWRQELDPQLHGSASFGPFILALEHLSFTGNVKVLWEELTEGRPGVTFRDIDPEASRTLEGFREILLDRFGDLVRAWEHGLDLDALGRIDEAEFLNAVEVLGVPSKRGRRLFRLLLSRHGQRSLTQDCMQALLIGVHHHRLPLVWAGASAAEARNQRLDSASPLPAGPAMGASMWTSKASGTASAWSSKVRKSPASPRSLVAEASRAHHEQDVIVRSVDRFKSMLVRRHGSLFSAWRKVLDTDQNAILTRVEFAKACQFLGIKAVQSLWADLDSNKLGQISLRDLDPEVAELFAQLERMILEKFGDTKRGWKDTFDLDSKLRCDLGEWRAGCIKLGFHGEGDKAERLFRLLRPEPGRPYLMYEDLWVDVDRNGFEFHRGPPKKLQH